MQNQPLEALTPFSAIVDRLQLWSMTSENLTIKACCQCQQEKPLDRFVRDKARPDGYYPVCKDCRREYYLSNRQRVLDQARSYRQKNRTRICEHQKRYAKTRFFWKTASNLRLRHPGEKTASYRELASLWKLHRGCCAVTGRRLNGNNAQLDHITPIKAGGLGILENLRWVHRDVNYAKRDLSDADFARLICDSLEWSKNALGRKEW